MKEIPLTQGRVSLIDDNDYTRVMQHKWYYNGAYAMRNMRRGVHQQMSNFIVQVPNSIILDHIDRNPLNNQKYNLRPCTRLQNNRNLVLPLGRSGYRGVAYYHDKRCSNPPCWVVHIRAGGRPIHLGYFDDPVEAARAYDAAAREHHGEFAVLNFPDAILQSYGGPI